MPSRRRLLVGISGVTSLGIAGCTGDTGDMGNGESQTDPPEAGTPDIETETPEPRPANFIISEGREENFDMRQGNSELFTLTIENRGDESGTQTIKLNFNDDTVSEREITLAARDSNSMSFNITGEEITAGGYRYSYHTENDSFTGGEVYLLECPDDDEVPPSSVIELENLSMGNTIRANFHLRLSDNGNQYSRSELITITKAAVCAFTENEKANAVSTTFWEPGDVPGYEAAYAECNWAPHGNWSYADNVDAGDYSTHEYSLRIIG